MAIPTDRRNTMEGQRSVDPFVSFVGLSMLAGNDGADDVDRCRRRREERLGVLRQLEEDTAAPPPCRLTLAKARAKWPEWAAAHNKRREHGRAAATERLGTVVADLLLRIHLPELPPPTEVVAYALDLECGHEEFWLAKRADASTPNPERARCPVFWSCQLNDGRTAVRYVAPGEPKPQYEGSGLTRWSVALACGHAGEVLRAEESEDRVGDYLVCRGCGGDDPDFDVEIVALGERLPDRMVQNWTVELDCGHTGTDYYIPVECQDDPAAYRAAHPTGKGLRCIDDACDERQVRGVRRLGVLGKIRIPPVPASPPDPVATAARDLRRRLSKQERQALIRQLQEDE
jgi:hypothetical protein